MLGQGLIGFLIVGLIAGWAAGRLTKGSGFGLIGNLVVGCVGAFAGGLLFWVLGLGVKNIIGAIIAAVIGSVICLFVAAKLKNRSA
ncbi:MAG: GlsB/YeaQ/YmgE family stress response membrane protein [Rhodospirillales bacterium]|nr:GlsB/YeaQ/YmgE family stress response membrane protein [Rhodospirillales bacterium]